VAPAEILVTAVMAAMVLREVVRMLVQSGQLLAQQVLQVMAMLAV
jgi:hypothetical protein